MPNAIVRASATALPKIITRADFDQERDILDDLSVLPDRYGMYVIGDCLAPEIPDGACVQIDKSASFRSGDLVIVYRRREAVPKGRPQSLLKRLVMARPPSVTFPYRERPDSEIQALVMLEQRNPRQQFVIRCADILGVHKCVGVAPQGSGRRVRAGKAPHHA